MSIAVMTAVWNHSKARGTDLLVLLALADKANDDGECWPSMATIGRQARLAPRNARERIRSLEKLGEVVVIENGGRARDRPPWRGVAVTAPAWVEELRSRPTIRPRRWAEISGTAPSSVYDALVRGDLPSLRLGGALHIPTAPLLKLLGVDAETEVDV